MLSTAACTAKECLVAFSAAIPTHLALLRLGDWDTRANHVCGAYLLGFAALTCLFVSASRSWSDALTGATLIALSHLLGLAGSISVYRRYFHRLAAFPGPVLGSLSSLYLFGLCLPDLHQSARIQDLHRKYGDYVRIAPNKISIADAAAAKLLYGPASTTTKGPFYEIAHPLQTMQMTRDNKLHDERRRLWDLAFQTQGLRGYVPTISKHTAILMDVLRKRSGSAVEMSTTIDMFAFDAMFELGFGKEYNQLATGKADSYIATTHGMVLLFGALFHSPWIFQLINSIPGSARSYRKFVAHGLRWVDERLKQGAEQPDLLNFLVEHYRDHTARSAQDYEMLIGDANLLMLAGSDTTATTLCCAFYFLAQHPQHVALVRDSLSAVDSAESLQLYGTPHLDAVINETMRLKPLMPTGSERVVPPQGLTVGAGAGAGATHLPGGAVVLMPSYTTFRDPRRFERPDEFLPERWTTRPELVLDDRAFVPFSKGKFNCAGKKLAMMEMRSVIGEACRAFEWWPARADAARRFERTCRDGAVLRAGKLDVLFTPRP